MIQLLHAMHKNEKKMALLLNHNLSRDRVFVEELRLVDMLHLINTCNTHPSAQGYCKILC